MAKFAAMNKLKKAALLVAARSLSEAEITGLSNLFKSIDTDGSGTITVDEMRQAVSKMGSHFQARSSTQCCMLLPGVRMAFALASMHVEQGHGSALTCMLPGAKDPAAPAEDRKTCHRTLQGGCEHCMQCDSL